MSVDYEIVPPFDEALNRRIMQGQKDAERTAKDFKKKSQMTVHDLMPESMEARLEEARQEARDEEREACAILMENLDRCDEYGPDYCASVIRARGEKTDG